LTDIQNGRAVEDEAGGEETNWIRSKSAGTRTRQAQNTSSRIDKQSGVQINSMGQICEGEDR
jgi:hypothetical protein